MEKSKCCNAEVKLRGGCDDRHPEYELTCQAHHTMYYECAKCEKPCDFEK